MALTGGRKMTHYEEMYKKLLATFELNIKQYNRLQEKYDDVMIMMKRYSDRTESYIKLIEQENTKLREKLIEARKLMDKYENRTNQ